MITYTYVYKLKLNKSQLNDIENNLEVCRKVYNFALSERKAWLKSRKCQVDRCSLISEYIIPADTPYPNYFVQAKSLTEAKKTNDELKSVNAQVLQQTLKVIDRAFNDMKSRGNGFPRYKKKLKSFVYPAMLKGCLADGKVKLPQLGWARIRQSRSYPEGFAPKQARIVRRASGYFLMIIFQSKDSIPNPLPGKKSLGVARWN